LATGGLKPGQWEEDDCAICRLMALSEREGRNPTMEEMEEAFREAEKEGAYVGTITPTDD